MQRCLEEGYDGGEDGGLDVPSRGVAKDVVDAQGAAREGLEREERDDVRDELVWQVEQRRHLEGGEWSAFDKKSEDFFYDLFSICRSGSWRA